LSGAHRFVTGADLQEVGSVDGPNSDAIPGFDERVDLAFLRQVTQTMVLFIADWCGLAAR
jgi:hypothetical protein